MRLGTTRARLKIDITIRFVVIAGKHTSELQLGQLGFQFCQFRFDLVKRLLIALFYRQLKQTFDVFNALIQATLLPGLADSQCGFKCFSGAAADAVFPHQTIDGFAFDVEVLFLARKQGLSVVEVPITWFFDDVSSVKPVRDTWRMLKEVARIRANHLAGRYAG